MKSAELAEAAAREAGVACLSGTAFGAAGEGYLRLSYANSAENIRAALGSMAEFLAVRSSASRRSEPSAARLPQSPAGPDGRRCAIRAGTPRAIAGLAARSAPARFSPPPHGVNHAHCVSRGASASSSSLCLQLPALGTPASRRRAAARSTRSWPARRATGMGAARSRRVTTNGSRSSTPVSVRRISAATSSPTATPSRAARSPGSLAGGGHLLVTGRMSHDWEWPTASRRSASRSPTAGTRCCCGRSPGPTPRLADGYTLQEPRGGRRSRQRAFARRLRHVGDLRRAQPLRRDDAPARERLCTHTGVRPTPAT